MSIWRKVYEAPSDVRARTVAPHDIGFNPVTGWEVSGEIQEDYYEWVNYFEATHPKYGHVKGDFEDVVYASSQEAFDMFMQDVGYDDWDYWDI